MRQKKKLFALLALAAVLAAPLRANAWNNTGHEVIAYIAYQKLNQNARDRVFALLTQHPDYAALVKYSRGHSSTSATASLRLFVAAAVWPDLIRGDPRFYDAERAQSPTPLLPGFPDMAIHRSWHFADIPFSFDGTPVQSASPPAPENLVEVLPKLRDAIGDPAVPSKTRAYDLSWLMNLVGEVHQPLHCVTGVSRNLPAPLGDLGGNLVKIIYKSQTTTLHSYWDSLLSNYSPSYSSIQSEAAMIANKYQPTLPFDANKDASEKDWADEWALESLRLANFAYSIRKVGSANGTPIVSATYDSEAKRIAYKQAALAGSRLAAILNDEFK
jgi:S1/P1 Nuclease